MFQWTDIHSFDWSTYPNFKKHTSNSDSCGSLSSTEFIGFEVGLVDGCVVLFIPMFFECRKVAHLEYSIMENNNVIKKIDFIVTLFTSFSKQS